MSVTPEFRILALQQPWCWWVTDAPPQAQKLIENRRQRWSYRGPVLLHASAGVGSLAKFNAACERIEEILAGPNDGKPYMPPAAWERFRSDHLIMRSGGGPCFSPRATLRRGGIVAQARIVDCIPPQDTDFARSLVVAGTVGYPNHLRWWFRDQFGYVLTDVERLPFTPWKAGLGLRKAPPELLELLGLGREAA